jgi:hypothetical protein
MKLLFETVPIKSSKCIACLPPTYAKATVGTAIILKDWLRMKKKFDGKGVGCPSKL